jgi:hypothetical protein
LAALSLASMVALATVFSGQAVASSTVSVSQTPATYTPWLLKSPVNQNVQQLVQCGGTMYAVGTISAIGQGTNTYTRGNAFSFSATTGAVTAWDPQVNGLVHSITLSADCSTAYLGGLFTSVRGGAAKNLAAVDTVTGALKTSFAHSASAQVDTLQNTHGVILVGGKFTSINGASRSHFASLDLTTGAATTYANLAFTGTYPQDTTAVYNSQVSHSGSKLLIEGVFTGIGGQPRQQVAVLDLGATSVTLDGWYATELNQACTTSESFYAKGANWSPDDATIYLATTGYQGPTGPNTALCDASAAFPSTASMVRHKWINYTGCDSLYTVAADINDVYIAGHERYANNGHGCDGAGPGAVSRPGMGDINATTGLANAWNPTRDQGHGAQDLLLTSAGLWVASDNGTTGTSQICGHQSNHGGICFLPY